MIYKIINLICKFMVFPGSFWLWRRGVENNFGKSIANKTIPRIIILKDLINCIIKIENIK